VSGLVTGLEPGYTYWYEVVASNLAGETRSEDDKSFSYYYGGGYPYGLPGVQYRGMPPSPCELELVKQYAERTPLRWLDPLPYRQTRWYPGCMAKVQTKGSVRRVRSEFASLAEWDEWVNANCAAARADDTPVLMGQTGGSRKRATGVELMALVEEQRARYAAAGAGVSSSA